MNAMLDYSGITGSQEEICRRIADRLLNGSGVQQRASFITEPFLRSKLVRLREEFSCLALEPDRTKAGLALEPFINQLFEVFQLLPRQPFRVMGEQIDGSFELESHIYLLELKWEKDPLPEADLLIFRGKIEGKSTFTRGVFIALNDISDPAKDAITRGKAPSFFVMNGHDLMMILNEAISLPDYLRKRVRLLAEEGRVCVPFLELG